MNTTEILAFCIAGLTSIASILAWWTKLSWSKEYKHARDAELSAKDAALAAKDASIEQLKQQNQFLQDMSPTVLRTYIADMRANFDSTMQGLQQQIHDKEKELERLRAAAEQNEPLIAELLSERDRLINELERLREIQEQFSVAMNIQRDLRSSLEMLRNHIAHTGMHIELIKPAETLPDAYLKMVSFVGLHTQEMLKLLSTNPPKQ